MLDGIADFTVRAVEDASACLPELEVSPANPAMTAEALRDVLARHPMLFDRGGPVMLAFDQQKCGMAAASMTTAAVVVAAHRHCRPVIWKDTRDGTRKTPVALSDRIASLYLEGLRGAWNLRPLDGIASAPLLAEGGSIRTVEGYDPQTRLWCEAVPALTVPGTPTRKAASEALLRLRRRFRTFPFGDAERVAEGGEAVSVVDLANAPGLDESAFLVALLGAVCRPSLRLAPGVVLRAPSYSGAGTGKGLLARSMCAIAFGRQPHALTAGANSEEMDKRVTAALMSAEPVLFLDNLNGTALRSDTLAAAMTERPAHVRPLGRSATVPLNAATFVVVTGNGLSMSEDLVRRFIAVELDAGMEDPENRPFAPGFLQSVSDSRAALLSDALTIWRWGQQASGLARGRSLGSYETWCRWVRDPLLALGCADPVVRMEQAKAADPRRQMIAEVFRAWWREHSDKPVAAADLAGPVLGVLNPQGRGRQYVASRVKSLAGTRAAGFVLVEQPPAGKWTAWTYQLRQTDTAGAETHRTHRTDSDAKTLPMEPMSPMPESSRTLRDH
jgi:hypothetical protein